MQFTIPLAGFFCIQLLFGFRLYSNINWYDDINDDRYYAHDIRPAAGRFDQYEDFIQGKRLGLVVNHTSMVGNMHLVDTLLRRGHTITKIFSPEHGFRGDADAGEDVKSSVDTRTQIPILSVYGESRRPPADALNDVDIVIFDIQDVGVRFYTYTSTMTFLMEACAQSGKTMLILDRPNPNGHLVDGSILRPAQRSFVGLHPVPILHGLTVAEYARMINGEHWLKDSLQCDLYYVECENYTHKKMYKLPINPSPNLVDMRSIYLYPSVCFFEGTPISVGRGTPKPFQRYGHPNLLDGNFEFTPQPCYGAKSPLHSGKACTGYDLSHISVLDLQHRKTLNLDYLLNAYRLYPSQDSFFLTNRFFDLLAGDTMLRSQIVAGCTAAEIRDSWQPELDAYKTMRKQYLLYPDFE